ncbi:hypothetical protein GCM10023194_51760 [Planotetraspora phitsanulokensis]|uniref:Uncharacterized protein n=1 Tax=Planotetraspora phitsanulokensis TaxID=575192 RepID=A0A8J3U819_9ACTN|nr:MmcQ/YjbR family DNA-binding protein [Planotetraspora phitsanulokensis]GII39842.1 hypothetical protein Pph01_48450 [Planotetraspora phitsanulokensis]
MCGGVAVSRLLYAAHGGYGNVFGAIIPRDSMKILFSTSTGEIDLSADRATLRYLADLLTRGSGSMAAEITPDTMAGQTVLTYVRVHTVDGQSVLVAAAPESRSLSIAGARGTLKLFADNILAIAESNDGGHLHIEFYPDHAYLTEGSAPLVVNSPHGGMPEHGSTAEDDQRSPSMITLDDIRGYAMALPDVEEKTHFRLPGFRVADKLLAHLEKGDAHAIVCVGQAQAKTAATDEPDVYEEVWRNGRIFVGLRVDLAKVTEKRMQELIEHAWRNRAPKRLVAEYDNH